MTWAVAALCLGASAAGAQDDLGPPPKAPFKKSDLLPDDLGAPPLPPTKKVESPTKAASAKKAPLEVPGVDLPDDRPAVKSKPTPAPLAKHIPAPSAPTTLDLPAVPKIEPQVTPAKGPDKLAEDRVTMPSVAATPEPARQEKGVDAPTPLPLKPQVADAPRPLEDPRPVAATVVLSAPVTAQSVRPRKAAQPQPIAPEVKSEPVAHVIPAPESAKLSKPAGTPIAASEPRDLRNARRKAIETDRTKRSEEPAAKPAIIQAAAVQPPPPKPQDRYELVQPQLANYDVVRPRTSPATDALATVYETPTQLLERGRDGEILQAGATEGGAAPVESYAVKIWKIDGWETFQELARMEYRDDALASPLAKYNRSAYRPTDALPAGQKVRLPPKWVLERSGTTVARRPAPVRSDFSAPPATTVQAQPAGTGMVASSGDRRGGGLVKNSGASPLPKEQPPRDEGPIFVVNEREMTLYKLAKRTLGDGQQWPKIYDLNRNRLSSSQAELKVGTRLRMPEGSLLR